MLFVTGRTNTTVCPRSSDLYYIVTYCIKWVTTSWTYSIYRSQPVELGRDVETGAYIVDRAGIRGNVSLDVDCNTLFLLVI